MKKLFVIHDTVAGLFTDPATISSERDAIEAFTQAVNNPQTQYSKFPADFDLILVGEYNEMTSQITTYSDRVKLKNGAQLKNN